MSHLPDAAARQEALDPTRSFIVQAPAGSGKTELLIQRYIKLLGGAGYPEQVLAMTFTRKAAGEMKNRVLDALAKATRNEPPRGPHEEQTLSLARLALARDRQRQWRLLDNPARLHIMTIDAFCLRLARKTPLLSRLGNAGAIDENPAPVHREAARRVLELVEAAGETGGAVRLALSRLDNSKSAFLDKAADLLARRDQWYLPFFEKNRPTAGFRQMIENTLTALIESELRRARGLLPQMAAARLPGLAALAAQNLRAESPAHPIACLQTLDALPAADAASLPLWQALAKLLLTSAGEWRSPGGVNKNIGFPNQSVEDKENKKEFQWLLQSLINLRDGGELRKALANLLFLPAPQFGDHEWSVLQAMLRLLPELEGTLRSIYSERGRADFTEIAFAALRSLHWSEDEDAPSDLLLKLDMRLQHILVDEFQDTSFKQYRLLKKLLSGWMPDDGRTLFVVGDRMQSIYRFRDAEVSLFLDAWHDGIDPVSLERLTLTANFRSHKPIIEWVNECFAATFPREDDLARGLAKYEPAHAPETAGNDGGVHLHALADAPPEEEARRTGALIQKLREQHAGDSIAVLGRARPHLFAIARRLRELGVPFRAEEITPLSANPMMLDLLALLRALVSFYDRMSWLATLRAPWCGLSLADLHQLCHDDAATPVWELVREPARLERLSADGQRRVRRFTSIMSAAVRVRNKTAWRRLLEGCWTALGGPACVSPAALRDARALFARIAAMEAGGLIDGGQLLGELEDLYSGSPASGGESGAVILTMHKAKGLEFDHVILPGLGRPPRRGKKKLLLWLPFKRSLVIAPAPAKGGEEYPIYEYLSRLEREKDAGEDLRLLYVASTRARKQLHLFGHVAVKEDGAMSPAANSALERLWPFLEKHWPETASAETAPAAPTAPATPAAPRLDRLPADFPIPELALAAAETADAEPGPAPEYVWAGNQARCLGLALHAIFKKLAAGDAPARPAPREEMLRAALLSNDIAHHLLDAAAAEGLKAWRAIEADPAGQWILQPHRAHASEYAISGILDGAMVNRVIDRTFIDGDGARWIIDFKTGEHQGTDLEAFFRAEMERYRAQLQAYARLLRQSGETRPIRAALYYPLHRRLIEY